MLLVFGADPVGAGAERESRDLHVHIGRRRSPDHKLVVDPDVEAVIALAVQLQGCRLGQVPETLPSRAEEPCGQRGVIIQEVEADTAAGIIE